MGSIDLSTAVWRKSKRSNTDGGECVEAATNFPGTVPVRDSKHPQGPALLFPTPAFTTFIQAVQSDTFTPR
ncbi:DUF397 domain-containing protein [Streptomyces paludis]|uniref:DUF397 domain-containing protein n=1 Tax=Streptomyces paludis TaxID=2282738 RepID=A0A345HLF4_9ACTN|nr:DUF397 domain-containing protein [Streptomyces paludis]AXG77528.1 DUF397 domain-containing protein [Streptomyces paludis]